MTVVRHRYRGEWSPDKLYAAGDVVRRSTTALTVPEIYRTAVPREPLFEAVATTAVSGEAPEDEGSWSRLPNRGYVPPDSWVDSVSYVAGGGPPPSIDPEGDGVRVKGIVTQEVQEWWPGGYGDLAVGSWGDVVSLDRGDGQALPLIASAAATLDVRVLNATTYLQIYAYARFAPDPRSHSPEGIAASQPYLTDLGVTNLVAGPAGVSGYSNNFPAEYQVGIVLIGATDFTGLSEGDTYCDLTISDARLRAATLPFP